MTLRINTNPTALNTLNQINKGYRSLLSSLEKLSSGKRINKAADDTSGMVIADSLNSQADGLGQAIRNASDAISIAQVADGALEETVSLITTIRTKSIQAANASQSMESRAALQADITSAVTLIDKIAKNTSFNGQKLLSGGFTDKNFQVGATSNETIDISIASAEANKLGVEQGSLSEINVLTEEGAQNAILIADSALQEVDSIRGNIGSTQNQLESSINNLQTAQINIAASESAIRDVDFADEVMNHSKLILLAKSRTFALAQVKELNESILGVLNI